MEKNRIVIFLIALFSSAFVYGQDNLTDEQKEEIKTQIKADIESLELSEEQKGPYKESAQKHLNQLMELRNSDKPRRIKFREAKSIRASRNSEMKELLSEEQYQMYLEIQERRKEEIKERRKQ